MQELDIENPGQLLRYLRDTGRIGAQETPRLQTLHGGVSNRTVLVERLGERAGGQAGGSEDWVLKQALAKLRVAVDWFSSPERVHREALGLRWLAEIVPPGATCRLVFEDAERHLIAMSAVPEPHESWKTMLLAGRLDADHVRQFGFLLGTIHRRSWERRGELSATFNDRGFFESLRLEPYYSYTASQVPEAADFIDDLIAATRATRLCLTHGDYSPKNVLVYQERLILLDHEVIHFGDPAFDLGFSLTHFLGKANHLPGRRADFAAAAVDYWKAYRDALGETPWSSGLEERAARHTLACTLARVAGRSPLEYLTSEEGRRQRQAAVQLMASPPAAVADLVREFVSRC